MKQITRSLIPWTTLLGLTTALIAGPSPSPQAPFSTDLNQMVESAVAQLSGEEAMQMRSGFQKVQSLASPGPGGLIALTYGRETPDGPDWPVLIMRPGPVVDAYYDGFHGHHIVKLEWAGGGKYLVVQAVSDRMASTGGELSVILLEKGKVKQVDQDVYQYTVSADGLQLVYEKAVSPGDNLGPRAVIYYNGNTNHGEVIHKLDYPKMHLEKLGKLDLATNRVEVSLTDYSKGLTRARPIVGHLGLLTHELATH